jgi:hypothetical protein
MKKNIYLSLLLLTSLNCSSILTAEYHEAGVSNKEGSPNDVLNKLDLNGAHNHLMNLQKSLAIGSSDRAHYDNVKKHLKDILKNAEKTGLTEFYRKVLTLKPEEFNKWFTPDVLKGITYEQSRYQDYDYKAKFTTSPNATQSDLAVVLKNYTTVAGQQIPITPYSLLAGIINNADKIKDSTKDPQNKALIEKNLATLGANMITAVREVNSAVSLWHALYDRPIPKQTK